MNMRRVLFAALVVGIVWLGVWAMAAWSQETPDEAPPPTEQPAMEQHEAPAGGPVPPVRPSTVTIPGPPPPAVEPEPEPEPPPEVAPEPLPPPAPVRPMPIRPRTLNRPSTRFPDRRLPQPPQSSQPPQPSDDALPKEGGKPGEPISFDFMDTPLDVVVKSIARMTGKNFDVDPTIASQRITVVTHDKIPPEMAYEVLQALLAPRGFALVETIPGHLIKVVQTGQEGTEKIPMVKGVEGVPKSYDELSTHIVKIKHADAAELVNILKSLGSKACTVDAYAKTNTLIITDTADGLRRVFSFLEEIDIPGFDTEMEIFTLEYARAEVLSSQIQEVLMGTGGAPMPGRPGMPEVVRRTPQMTRPSIRPTIPGQTQSMVVGSKDQTLRMVADERLNTLIVVATGEIMERVRDLISKLDTPTPYEANNMNIYKLLNAPSEQVEKALNAILGTTPRQGSEKGGAQSGEIQPFEKKVVVTRYEEGNALLILASPQDYKLIREIIAQLDVPQRQVMVEAVIMDVSLQNNFGLTVDAAGVKGADGFALTNTSNLTTLSTLMSTTDLATSLTNGTAAVSMAQALLGLGTTGGLTAGWKDSISVKVPTSSGYYRTVKVPFVPLLLKALETLTDVDILSQPSLTTQDNQSADIVIGQEVPVPTARSGYTVNPNVPANQQQQISNYGLQSYGRGISRQDVGVKMKVKPHINEGDYVSLETEIEVSKPITSTVGIDPNDLGPTFQKSKVSNNVVVKDGNTGIIGGLMEETVNHKRDQVPILGDLPLIGWLFGKKSNGRDKHNVVILVTPYIIKEGVDLERLSKHKIQEFRDANVDVLFERNIIKKTRKSMYMRNKHRPSVDRSQEMLDKKEDFGRSDIAR